MTDLEFTALVTTCKKLPNDQKVHLIKSLLGDRSIDIRLPEEEKALETDSIPQILKVLADSVEGRGGGRLKFELYKPLGAA